VTSGHVKLYLEHNINDRLLATDYFKKEGEWTEEEYEKEAEKLGWTVKILKEHFRLNPQDYLKKKKEKEEEEEKRKQAMVEKQKKKLERKEKERIYRNLVSQFKGLTLIYAEIKIVDLKKKLPKEIQENYSTIFKKSFVALIEEMIMNKDINARIKGEYLTFLTGEENSKPILLKETVSPKFLNGIIILRGGDWKIEVNQSVFYFKVKVKNNSSFVITNIQILLTSIPTGLISQADNYKIEILNPNSFESPTFKFIAKDSCVGDFIKGTVLLTDHMGNQHTITINPFRIEGQKTIPYRALENSNWEAPDWIVYPGGALGNTSSCGKSLMELFEWKWINKVPRIAVVNAEGANTLYDLYNGKFEETKLRWNKGNPDTELIKRYYSNLDEKGSRPKTKATAIQIGRPSNILKALRALEFTDGVVTQVSDEEMLDGMSIVGLNGFDCEMASGSVPAGIKKLLEEEVIKKDDIVIGILTGRQKDAMLPVDYHNNPQNRFAIPPKK